MKVESSFLLEVWEITRDFVPAGRKLDTAVSLMRSFEEFGMDNNDLVDVIDEDDTLTAAYKLVFGLDSEDEDLDNEGYED